MRMASIFYFVFLSLVPFTAFCEDNKSDFILLITTCEGVTSISGNGSLADKPFSPMSTFKIIIAWAALEEELVDPTTVHLCHDPFISKEPIELTMKEAMYKSSNDYFAWLAGRLGEKKLNDYLTKSRLLLESPPSDWLAEGMASAAHGGSLRVTPRQQHQFILRVREEKLTANRKAYEQLLEVMRWPKRDEMGRSIDLYGKTGTGGGVAWFNGFGRISPPISVAPGARTTLSLEAVTYFTQYDEKKKTWKDAREKAIDAFYSVFLSKQ